jgi:hypothetical protein
MTPYSNLWNDSISKCCDDNKQIVENGEHFGYIMLSIE